MGGLSGDAVFDAARDRWSPPLVLCNISMSTVGFVDFVAAAAAGGFDAVSLLTRSHRRALLHEGLTDTSMRQVLDDHGIGLTEIEAAGDWLGPPPEGQPKWLTPAYSTAQALDVAAALGATTLLAVHFGAPAPIEYAAERFAALCDAAAAHDLLVAIEFVAFATITDVHTASEIVRLADRPNGGLMIDNWHHRRSTNDDAALASVPASRILSVQLSDAVNPPKGPPVEDVTHRRHPGTGDLEVKEFVRLLNTMGVRSPIGVEVYDAPLLATGPEHAAVRLGDALREVIASALGETDGFGATS